MGARKSKAAPSDPDRFKAGAGGVDEENHQPDIDAWKRAWKEGIANWQNLPPPPPFVVEQEIEIEIGILAACFRAMYQKTVIDDPPIKDSYENESALEVYRTVSVRAAMAHQEGRKIIPPGSVRKEAGK